MEFTGERVVPGQVNADLWGEHLARYVFATRLLQAEGARLGRALRVLDAGCGTGYGSALLAACGAASEVAAVDNDTEALDYARSHYAAESLAFSAADCMALPYPAASFDFVVAFEVIEHLPDAAGFLAEARRVLSPAGRLLASTPNRRYYSEEREYTNPFHTREYLPEEFDALLAPLFQHRTLIVQNHVAGQGFSTAGCGGRDGSCEIENPRAAAAEAHFLIVFASDEPLPELQPFLFLPTAANVLRDREEHIRKLDADLAALQRTTRRELDERKAWAEQQQRELETRDQTIRELQQEHEQTVAWGGKLEQDLEDARNVIAERQRELDERFAWVQSLETERQRLAGVITELQADLEEKVKWARSLEAEFQERTAWALSLEELLKNEREQTQAEFKRLDGELQALKADMRLILESTWYRAGKKLGASPVPQCDNGPGGRQ